MKVFLRRTTDNKTVNMEDSWQSEMRFSLFYYYYIILKVSTVHILSSHLTNCKTTTQHLLLMKTIVVSTLYTLILFFSPLQHKFKFYS